MSNLELFALADCRLRPISTAYYADLIKIRDVIGWPCYIISTFTGFAILYHMRKKKANGAAVVDVDTGGGNGLGVEEDGRIVSIQSGRLGDNGDSRDPASFHRVESVVNGPLAQSVSRAASGTG